MNTLNNQRIKSLISLLVSSEKNIELNSTYGTFKSTDYFVIQIGRSIMRVTFFQRHKRFS